MDSMFNTLLARALAGGGGGGGTGTDDYIDLNNKPKVNDVTVVGNLTSSDLKLQGEITNSHKLSADLVADSTSTNKFNVQADWDQTTNSAPDYIKNKPTLGTAAATDATAYATTAQGTKADSAIQTVEVNGTALTPTSAKAVNITVPTQASDINALPNTTKYAAALSLTIDSSTFVVTGQLKDQNGDNLGTAQTIDLPLESVVVGGSYDSQTKKVILTLQNGNTVEFSIADLVSGLQTELSATNKLDPSFINYDTTHAAVTESDKTTWSGKQDALTFDGTYSASTNKAATVSTVTNAVNALDVTGDASVSASKTISAWSETDGKVSISTQDIAIAGTQTTLTGYAKSGTAGQAVAATDSVNQAIGKLEATIDDNKNNILLNTNQGVKNLFNLTKASGTYNTVVFTVNSDKTVTINGTASPFNSIFNLDDWTCTKAGTYVVSGAPSGGSWAPSPNTYRIRVAVNGTWKGDDVGNGFALTLAVGDVINLQINTGTSYTANNLIFKPMITLKSLYNADPTYQPYAMSNAELTAALGDMEEALAEKVDKVTGKGLSTNDFTNEDKAKVVEVENSTLTITLKDFDWETGIINMKTGKDTNPADPKFIRTKSFYKTPTDQPITFNVDVVVNTSQKARLTAYYYDENKNLISTPNVTNMTVTVPYPYFRLVYFYKDTPINVDINDARTTVMSYRPKLKSNDQVKLRNQYVAFGDSITWGHLSGNGTGLGRATNPYPTVVGRNLDFDVTYGAQTGCGWVQPSGDKTAVTIVDSFDCSNYNLATLAFGTNDWYGNIPIGTISDTGTDTIIGAMKHCIEKILTDNPSICLIIITPINAKNLRTADNVTHINAGNYRYDTENTINVTLKQICEAEKEVAEYYGIPCIDNSKGSIVNRVNITNASIFIDSLHPTDEFYKVLGQYYSGRIGSIFNTYSGI